MLLARKNMGLSRQQRKKLQDALLDAFPEKASLERMLAYELDKNLDEIAGGSNLQEIVFNLIKKAEAEKWIKDLVRAAQKSNPGNLSLRNIAEELLSGSGGIPFAQQQKNRRDLLEEVEFEVTARLESSLHNAVWINLRKESQPQQVKRPWDAEIKIGSKLPESLPNSTTTLEVFDRKDIAGRLLIFGNPGAGKTTTMLDLAQSLVTRAKEQVDYPIPVLLNLSSWKNEKQKSKDKHQKFSEWLVIELKLKYGIHKKVGQDWLQNKQILPLLDGLDEVKPELQKSCIIAINQFLQEFKLHHVVVCSRSEEYSNLDIKLSLNGTIYLQSLNNSQIDDYLKEVNCIRLRQAINHDSNLLELVRTPFLLSVSIFCFQEIPLDNWQQLSSTTDRIQHLLDAYVIRMLNRYITSKAYDNKKAPNKKQTRLWLVWLAKQLQKESKTEFLIEEIQPYWLVKKSQLINYWLIYELIFGIIFGLIFGLIGLIVELNYGLIGLIIGLIFGLTVLTWIIGLTGLTCRWDIKLHEKIIFLKFNKKIVFTFLTFGLIPGLIGLIFGLITGLIGLIFGLTTGLIFGLISVEAELDIETKKIPNQGIWKSAIIGLIYGLIYGLHYGLIIWSIGLNYGLNYGLILGLIIGLIGLIYGLITGLIYGFFFGGGMSCIQHLSLRLILYYNGYIPWNYAQFLNYSTERLFLQRVGGRYRFIHKMVQEHFANMEFNTD